MERTLWKDISDKYDVIGFTRFLEPEVIDVCLLEYKGEHSIGRYHVREIIHEDGEAFMHEPFGFTICETLERGQKAFQKKWEAYGL